MTVDALLNILLISFFDSAIEIIAVSNIGYVFATCAALVGLPAAAQGPPELAAAGEAVARLGAARERCCSPRTSCS